MRDGRFWLGENMARRSSLAEASGQIVRRLVPAARRTPPKPDWTEIAARHRRAPPPQSRVRGDCRVASEERLYAAFQSPLAHPGRDAFKARHVRLWELDARRPNLASISYPLDAPHSFVRDNENEKIGWQDLKICELTAVGERVLLVLERSSETCKIYRVELGDARRTPAKHHDIETRPTIEEMSATGELDLPALDKQLLFTSDDYRAVAADIEGMTLLSDRSLLLVSDNDYGVEDKKTKFYRLNFAEPFAGD